MRLLAGAQRDGVEQNGAVGGDAAAVRVRSELSASLCSLSALDGPCINTSHSTLSCADDIT